MEDADWPDEVPVLVADDVLVSDEFDSKDGRRTLSLWVRLSFSVAEQVDHVLELLTQTVAVQLGRRKAVHYYEVSQPGDGATPDPTATPELMARAWNAAMRELDYNAPDPKPKKKPKAKKPIVTDPDDFLE